MPQPNHHRLSAPASVSTQVLFDGTQELVFAHYRSSMDPPLVIPSAVYLFTWSLCQGTLLLWLSSRRERAAAGIAACAPFVCRGVAANLE